MHIKMQLLLPGWTSLGLRTQLEMDYDVQKADTHTHSRTLTRTHVTNVLSSDQYGTELLPDCDRHDVKSIVPTGRPWIQSNHAELVAGVFVINTNTQ